MTALTRTDTRPLSQWWWSVDRWLVIALAAIVTLGAILILAAAPPAAERMGLGSFQLVQRQFAYLGLAVSVLFAVSLLSPVGVRRLGLLGLAGALALLALTPLVGVEINGAQRWLHLGGLSIQPSELVKPVLAVTVAWMLTLPRRGEPVPGDAIALALVGLTCALLLSQPDLGQTLLVVATLGVQLFVAGLSWLWVAALGATVVGGLVIAYLSLPYVAERIDAFLAPGPASYQVERALTAFERGGLLGTGPGEGTVKASLPDAHADFILAVAGEELGGLAAAAIVGLFAFVVLRGFVRLLHDDNLFVVLAGTGLLASFGIQAAINMGSTLHLIPTKGMTLPLVSYGGSSLMGVALAMGMLVALTRRSRNPEGEA
ncbi:cell division protein FtsW [Limimonas halophila]|uniref:Probable peptidoglycan glycosyltransferase FtsW n=1 Tax=Limimonas halophila TaxID=1082479 RepID=A0A1G7U6V3_9PROT|nr:putative peptidoglycan glycosyltransferase FtsW [Limimonas halophila]SDG42779.1 cell division protein FtsW [Limimonas halophila]